MKTLSLWQPWALLIALGEKRLETRSWGTSYRGELVIQSAMRWKSDQVKARDELLERHPRLEKALDLGRLELGVGLCVVRVVWCREMDQELIDRVQGKPEYDFGHYEIGRFAWGFKMIGRLKPSVQMRGRQRMWNVTARTQIEASLKRKR